MMTPGQALLLGLIQGLTEFFPISSSGHLVLGEALLGVNPGGVAFEVSVHVATMLAVVLYYARRIYALAAGALRGDRAAWLFVGKLAAASVPAAAVGLTLEAQVARTFDEPALAAGLLLVTGAVLFWSRGFRAAARRPAEPSWTSAIWVGVAQAFALLPGISRSGMTVVAGLRRGLDPARAAEFSFLLSLPAILGASILEVPELVTGEAGASWVALLAAFVAAGVSGFFALVYLVRWLERGHLHRFAYYCWAVGALFLLGWALR